MPHPLPKTALVTGGAIRIGRSIALELARNGIDVAIHYANSAAAAEETLAELRTLGVQAVAIPADFNSPVTAAESLIANARSALGPLDLLVNSAAIFEAATLTTTTEANWDRHLDINLKAPFFLTKAFAAQLKTSMASVINIVDWRGSVPVPGHAAYTIAKAALIAQTQLLAQELGPRIRVNGIAPGAILPAPNTSQEAFAARGARNPLHRIGEPADIARAVLFLLQSPFVTGEILHITGGEHLAPGTHYPNRMNPVSPD
ncbi:MAG: SDR family oxidoreductase [Planctomycetaceae bacterium]|nr:SDR family oxidoreductase [Planctomycetaceae bacterium]